MPFAYQVAAANVSYTTHGTTNTELAWMALRQATHGFAVSTIRVGGKASALTTLSSMHHHIKRWTTAGSGGTSLTPTPIDPSAPASATTAADGQTAITPGTVSGVVVLAGITNSATGPGGFSARDENAKPRIKSGSDELDIYSIAIAVSLVFVGAVEIEE